MADNGSYGAGSYPFVNWEALGENAWSLTKSLIGSALGSYLRTEPESRNTVASKLWGGIWDEVYTVSSQDFRTKWQDTCPKIAAWQEFAESPAKLRYIYTIEMAKNGQTYELPVYIQSDADPDPDDAVMVANMDTAVNTRESAYNATGKSRQFYRSDFGLIAAEKFTRGDFKRLADPESFARWFVMDECWNMQQYGKLESTQTKNDSHGNAHTVRKYAAPSAWDKWIYWAVGDMAYDIIDVPFDPIQEYMIKHALPSGAQQDLIKEEYKMIAGIRRSVFRNTARNPLEFDLTD